MIQAVPTIFTGSPGENIIDFKNALERYAKYNNIPKHTMALALPLLLENGALIYYETLPQ